MATADFQVVHVDAPIAGQERRDGEQKSQMHRINEVRRQQCISLRSAARRMGTDMATVRSQDRESTDLRLSDLYRWQKALEVPIADLLIDPNTPLSRPVMERAALVKLMKTVLAIQEQSESVSVERLAQTLANQLIEMMPELENVTPWHAVGQRRGLDEVGRIAEEPIPSQFMGDVASHHDD